VVTALTAAGRIRRPGAARVHGRDPAMVHFYGAPPMALLTVGAATLLVGARVVGEPAAVTVDWVAWSVGTLGGLVVAVAVPYRLFTRIEVGPDAAFGGWLMPVVPPMVSAATGALLLPHLRGTTARATMLDGCEALFGMSLVASLIIVTLIWSRLALHGSSASTRVPTLWIVLGPLGQSVTAAGALGAGAHLALPPALAGATAAAAVLYGMPVWGFALLWAALAAALTLRAVRRGLRFALTWWSFTFPVGTVVTATSHLATETGLPVLAWAAVALFAVLLAAWATVAAATLRAGFAGVLLAPPPAAVAWKGTSPGTPAAVAGSGWTTAAP
jgi:tellurite resistance protein TehA-like permease